MIDDAEIWVVAPQGFRPSNWVDMLRDFDVAFDLDPYLVDPGVVQRGGKREEVLVVRMEILDPAPEAYAARLALFWEMFDRVASLGLQMSFPNRLKTDHQDYWERILLFCEERKVQFAVR